MATVYKRGSIWWGRVQRKGVEHRTSLETRDKRIAQERLAKWVEELKATAWGAKRRVSFRDAAKAFVTEYFPTLKPSSAERYGISLEWLSEKLQDLYIDEIGREALSSFETWRRGLGVSNPTIRRDLACLSSLYSFCEDREWIDDGENPVPAFMKRRAKRGLKESPSKRRYLTELEEAELLAHCTPDVRDAVIVAIDSGLRSTEMFSLTWPQIVLAKGIIQTTSNTKNKRLRSVPLPERSARILAHKKAIWERENPRRKTPSFFVFAHEDGARILRMNKGLDGALRRTNAAAAKSKGTKEPLARLSWHDLRRTAGCRWLQRDRRSMEEVSIMLGHSSIEVTEKTYAFLDEEAVARDIAAQKPAHKPTDNVKTSKKINK